MDLAQPYLRDMAPGGVLMNDHKGWTNSFHCYPMNVKCTSDHSILLIAAEGICSVTATAIKVHNIFLT